MLLFKLEVTPILIDFCFIILSVYLFMESEHDKATKILMKSKL